jgi:hypothetical protein
MKSKWTAVVTLALLPAVCLAQSLGSAAEKEKERRKKNQDAGVKARTVTDADLKASHPADAAPPDTPPSASRPVPASDAADAAPAISLLPPPPDDRESQQRAALEAQWRARMAPARARLEKAKKSYDTLSKMSLVYGEEYVDDNGRTVVSSAEELQRLTARAKAELDAAQKNVDDLEEKARRENVPPGWLR